MVAQCGMGCRRSEANGKCCRLDRLEGISISNFGGCRLIKEYQGQG